jgi:putative multiple sugar transport system permease protein
MILIIIAGHIDLSAGSVVAATGAVSAVLMVNMDLPWPLAVLITIVVGAAIGAFQGYWIAYFGIPAFIVTLAGMLVFRAVTLTVLGNQGIGPFPDAVRTLSNGFLPGFLGNVGLGPLGGADLFTLLVELAAIALSQWRARSARLGYGQVVDPFPVFVLKIAAPAVVLMAVVVQLARFRNLPWVLVLLAALVVGYTLLTTRAVFGRHIYAVGGNEEAAVISGISVRRVVTGCFAMLGFLVALCGLMQTAYAGASTTTIGQLLELDAIAACVIGGTSLRGGRGTVAGVLFGSLIMASLLNGLTLRADSPEVKFVARGTVLALAVWLDVRVSRHRESAR